MTESSVFAVFGADGLHLIAGAPPGLQLGPDQVVSPLQAAVELAALDVLLQYCDSWFGRALDWRPAAAPSRPVELSLVDTTENRRVGLVLCDELIGTLPEHPEALDPRVQRCWHEIDTQLELDRLRLSERDLAALGPGSLLLLPASFAPTWRLYLLTTDYALPAYRAVLDDTADCLRFSGFCDPAPDEDTPTVCIRLLDPLHRPLRDYYCTPTVGESLAAVALPGARVCLQSELPLPCPSTGTLTRFGQGFAVVIDPSPESMD